MIETYKRQDAEALGAKKVGEGSGENEWKIGDIPEPLKTHHKNGSDGGFGMQDLEAVEECSCRECSGLGSALCNLPERVRELHSSP
jgi:hypothetical protein